MQNQNKRTVKVKYGICSQVADIVGTSRFYVSQVVGDPENNNGKVAQLIKVAYEKVNAHHAQIKEELLNNIPQK